MSGNNAVKTIKVFVSTHARLSKLKVHPNQSFDELLNKLLDEKEGKE